ncbi:hypothetical protein X777_09635 [Ooceraea biroi]|uniref:Uncharacterized protein n=1 Tax=Ooceraea biroi TaxID=2015173 RepID=A0A026W705_OOCBI|nr:hypothetical protein X777_09635 [Ooceraea biroi]
MKGFLGRRNLRDLLARNANRLQLRDCISRGEDVGEKTKEEDTRQEIYMHPRNLV